ncbi:MAG: MBL fold metallo-hydrolase [Vulcanimicrobiota bacterium]
MEGIFIHQFELGPWDNFIYLIGDRSSRSCMVVDPAWELQPILDEAARLEVEIAGVLCTHSHFDHVNMVDPLLKQKDIPVHMLDKEVDWSGFRCENLTRHASGEKITLGKHLEVTMVHTPGHTPGSVSYWVNGQSLVTGDTLFINGCGRCDFVGGDPEQMFYTLRGLVEKLPEATNMYPGHNYGEVTVATLDEQLKTNPYLKLPTVEDFVAHRMDGRKPNAPFPAVDPEWLDKVEKQRAGCC